MPNKYSIIQNQHPLFYTKLILSQYNYPINFSIQCPILVYIMKHYSIPTRFLHKYLCNYHTIYYNHHYINLILYCRR